MKHAIIKILNGTAIIAALFLTSCGGTSDNDNKGSNKSIGKESISGSFTECLATEGYIDLEAVEKTIIRSGVIKADNAQEYGRFIEGARHDSSYAAVFKAGLPITVLENVKKHLFSGNPSENRCRWNCNECIEQLLGSTPDALEKRILYTIKNAAAPISLSEISTVIIEENGMQQLKSTEFRKFLLYVFVLNAGIYEN